MLPAGAGSRVRAWVFLCGRWLLSLVCCSVVLLQPWYQCWPLLAASMAGGWPGVMGADSATAWEYMVRAQVKCCIHWCVCGCTMKVQVPLGMHPRKVLALQQPGTVGMGSPCSR